MRTRISLVAHEIPLARRPDVQCIGIEMLNEHGAAVVAQLVAQTTRVRVEA